MSGTVPSPDETNTYKIVRGIRDLFEGRRNTTGSVTLTANAASTTVTTGAAMNFAPASTVHFTPTTANGAAALSGMYVSAKAKQSFTITHANNAQTDRTFDYSIDG